MMKGKATFIMISILIICIACTKKEPAPIWQSEENKIQVFFFSDKEEYENEVPYYNAIIVLKKDFPEEINNMKTLSNIDLKNYEQTFPINHCPAIVVYDQEQVIYVVEGIKTTEDIITSLSKVLSET
ncbi:small peptidoglycan-associated lipoprotein [Niallia sp. XMNu-256]|uniref:small peptidoglycan-associated lipoprotein n=1 Tax=Niallia sp. XMNu-256 TaxID=3082444 RepID=UPI0030D29586